MSWEGLPHFEQSCREALRRLEADDSPYAERLRKELLHVLSLLQGWRDNGPPPTDVRLPTISRVLELYRLVMEYTRK